MIICLINKEEGVIGGRMIQAIEERKSSLSWYSRYERNPTCIMRRKQSLFLNTATIKTGEREMCKGPKHKEVHRFTC